jgi:hypothetical protein
MSSSDEQHSVAVAPIGHEYVLLREQLFDFTIRDSSFAEVADVCVVPLESLNRLHPGGLLCILCLLRMTS